MGGALLKGLVKTQAASSVAVFEPNSSRAQALAEDLGIVALPDSAAAAEAQTLILAIKPQVLATVAPQIAPHLKSDSLLISVLAGVTLQRLATCFPIPALIRAMPNTPALMGAGVTALSCADAVSAAQRQVATQIFEAVGQVLLVPENYMDAITALSGSGPGYLAVILEALIDGGVQAGLPRDLASTLAVQTMLGTASLVQAEQLHPAVLKDRVTSPGGTTIAGIAVLEAAGLRGTIMAAIQAAQARSQALNAPLL